MNARIMIRKFSPSIQILKSTVAYNKIPCRNTRTINISQYTYTLFHIYRRFYTDQVKPEQVVVDYDYVKKATGNRNTLIVDVREPDEIKEHGKIPNSINIPLGDVSTIFNNMPDTAFEKVYKRPKPSEDTEIIFYCMIGKRSGMAQQNVLNLGYKNVKNYLGSWTEWATKMQNK